MTLQRIPSRAAIVSMAALLLAPSVASAQTVNLFRVSSPFTIATETPAEHSDAASPLFGHDKGLGFGVKAGALFASLTGNTTYNSRTGLIGGVFFGGNRHGLAGVMAEVLYAQKGSGPAGAPITAHYLEIPVVLRINAGGIYGVVGPYVDIKLKASGLNVNQNYNGLDFGVLGGVGIEFAPFILEIRENLGFRNVLDTTSHLRSFAIMAGIRFN